MKNPLFQFINVLSISIFILLLYANSNFVINLFGLDMKKYHLSAVMKFVPEDTIPDSLNYYTKNNDSSAIRVIDSTSQRILLFGDSMVGGLMYRLNQYCKANGNELQNIMWTSASIQAYTNNARLKMYIDKYKPTYLIASLGSNELFSRDIERIEKNVREILNIAGNLKIIWIGPPNWKNDNGFNDAVERVIGSNRFFPSKNLTFERQRDGAHPTMKSFDMWVDSIAVWIKDKSACPIKMNPPKENYDAKLNLISVNGK